MDPDDLLKKLPMPVFIAWVKAAMAIYECGLEVAYSDNEIIVLRYRKGGASNGH